ncbi:halocyanin domain-containing protein [Halomarina litorea]|uniref:halocyanin domain-containing protein n=1 Tax=Halomarina litorea TaxID=2961595 RepID=UPI0020C31FFD|nr:halocyanin domain-containing protein [Halomarina sp. BCD28]
MNSTCTTPETVPATGHSLPRRRFLQSATLLAASGMFVGGASGRATATETPDLEAWFSNVSNYSGVVDERGRSLVLVRVGADGNGGAFAFEPACLRVDPGTTVRWEWTGEGGVHDVTAADGSYASELVDTSGHQFEHTFDAEKVTTYACSPHEVMGMKGAVVVGDADVGLENADFPAGESGDAEEITYLAREPHYGGWFSHTDNYGRTVDMRGRSLVRIQVGTAGNGGGFAISPAAVAIDPGTEVLWEWVGEDGPHKFTAENDSYESPEQSKGDFGMVFDGVGVSKYSCDPHHAEGMRGAIVVGDPYEGLPRVTDDEFAALGGVGLAGALFALFVAMSRERDED